MIDADIIIKEVDAPINNWCSSGHCAPKYFKIKGVGADPEKMRFFHFSGKGINGFFCEACLIVSQYLAKAKKNGVQ